MNNTRMIPPYTRYNFSSMKFRLWQRLQRVILVNPLPFASEHFHKRHIDILEKQLITLPWKKTFCYRYAIFLILLIKSLRRPNTQLTHFTYVFSSGGRLLIGMCWGRMLIHEYFCINCISLILLKYLDWGLMSVLVRVHFSMTYCQNEHLKINFRLDSQ